MQYFAVFDEQGNRITSYVEGVHSDIPKDAIAITEDEQALYVSGLYVRDISSGLPIEKIITPPSLTPDEIVAQFVAQVQEHMDSVAQTRNYDSIFTLCSYANEFEPNPKFQQEGKAAVLWRSAVWTKCYEILADVQAGTRSVPEDIITELPEMNWGETV